MRHPHEAPDSGTASRTQRKRDYRERLKREWYVKHGDEYDGERLDRLTLLGEEQYPGTF
ncbi:MAG: hypothetical protein WCE82_04010 [Halobacteriota archaeon]